MRPDNIEFLLAGATLIFAFGFLRFFSIWIENERRWRMIFWVVMIFLVGAFVFAVHPEPSTLGVGDFANSFIEIGGWLLPP